jgi:hypothetical protein
MSIVKTDQIQDRNGNPLISVADGVASGSFAPVGMRNRIINGDMRIDQRNAGASYTQVNDTYSLDRWKGNSFDGGAATNKFSVQRSATAPADFSNSLLVTSLAATADNASNIFNIEQRVEGFNSSDLSFGTANAKTITLSFWVRSSLTGTFGGAIKNSARNRAYPFTYTISSANTFEFKTVTIPGDTTGTWVGSTNGTGLWLSFGLGVGSTRSGTAGAWSAGDLFSATGAVSVVGTNGATFYITGVQLEAGTVVTPFERRPFGTELALCQRYFQIVPFVGTAVNTGEMSASGHFKVTMRTSPSLNAVTKTGPSYTGTDNTLVRFGIGGVSVGSATTNTLSDNMFLNIICTGLVSGDVYGGSTTVSAEL